MPETLRAATAGGNRLALSAQPRYRLAVEGAGPDHGVSMVPPDERDPPKHSGARKRRAPVPLVRLDGRWWNRGELFPLAAAPRIALRLPPQDDERGGSSPR